MGTSTPGGVGRTRSVIETWWAESVEWVLLTGDRRLVALGIVAILGAFVAVLEGLGAIPVTDMETITLVYNGLIVANVTLITVIVSINQLLLTRELQAPGELQSQIEDVVDYRSDVEEATDEIAPVRPLGFLRLLVEATRREAQRLGGYARNGVVSAGGEEIDDVVTTLTEQMDEIDALLTESDTGTFSVLSVMLETNYALQINRLRRLRAEYESAFGDAVHDSIDDLIDRLREIDIARQYFKSIYLQQELSALSRGLLYAGIPAEAVTIATLLVLPSSASGPEPVIDLGLLLPVTIAVGLLPLAILGSFILRTATVTRLTAATLPFTTPEQERWL